jgi:hypothetical protein
MNRNIINGFLNKFNNAAMTCQYILLSKQLSIVCYFGLKILHSIFHIFNSDVCRIVNSIVYMVNSMLLAHIFTKKSPLAHVS